MKKLIEESIFGLLCRYKGMSNENKSKVRRITENYFIRNHEAVLTGDVEKYSCRSKETKVSKICCLNTTTDHVPFDRETLSPFLQEVIPDSGWMPIFSTKPARPERYGLDMYRIAAIQDDPFPEIKESENLSYNKTKSTKLSYNAAKYAEGFSITWETIKTRAIEKFFATLKNMHLRMGERYAIQHYDALLAAGVANVANKISFNATADTNTQKTITTLNAAVNYLKSANKREGIGNANSIPFYIFARDDLEDRIRTALSIDPTALAAGGETDLRRATSRLTIISTDYPGFDTLSATKDTVLVVWPGGYFQNNFYLPTAGETFEWKNPDSLDVNMSAWISFTVAAGLETQAVQVELAA